MVITILRLHDDISCIDQQHDSVTQTEPNVSVEAQPSSGANSNDRSTTQTRTFVDTTVMTWTATSQLRPLMSVK